MGPPALALRAVALASLIACACAACVGTTGGQLVTFPAAAAGPADAIAGEPLRFTTDRGWTVVLSTATLHVGALYLDQSMPVSGSQGTNCVLPGTYVGQVTAGLDVNLLSPAPQPFPGQGSGTTEPPALVGQVWLTGGDVDLAAAPSPPTTILAIAGTASRGDIVMPFEGKLTIGTNRQASGGAAAGAEPLRAERFGCRPDHPGGHHRPGDVRPAYHAAASDRADLRPGDGDAEPGQPVDDRAGPGDPVLADLRAFRGECPVGRIEQVAEQVHATALQPAGQLDSRYERQPGGQRPRRRGPQRRVGAESDDVSRQPLGFAIVERGG